MKFAILFPGQGSQNVGMGADLTHTEIASEIIKKVNNIAGRKISDIFLHGPEEELNQTKNTQISIVIVSVLLTLILKEELKSKKISFVPSACCGHSLGEFTALWFLNLLNLEELIRLILIRGNLMQNAPPGGMAAILNLSEEKIKLFISEGELKDKLTIANYNSPTQYVISGEKETINKIPEKIKSIGGKAIILPVSGAFHSPLMERFSKDFNNEIDKLFILSTLDIKIPIYQNYDGKPSTDYKTIKEKIKKQMTSAVLWTQTINNLVNDGVNAIIEVGPGKILTGLVKKINPNVNCYNINNLASLKEFVTNHEHIFPQSQEHSKAK